MAETPTSEEFLQYYAGAPPELTSFMVPMVLAHGVPYAVRYIQTERSNRSRFAPLIATYIEAFHAGDADKGAETAIALLDLAESIWKADA